MSRDKAHREAIMNKAEKYLKNRNIEDMYMAVDENGDVISALDLMADFLIECTQTLWDDKLTRSKDLSIDIYNELNKEGGKLGSYSTTIIKNILLKKLPFREDLLYRNGLPEEISTHLADKLLTRAFKNEKN